MVSDEVRLYNRTILGEWYSPSEEKIYCFMSNHHLFIQDYHDKKESDNKKWGLYESPMLILVYLEPIAYKADLDLEGLIPRLTIIRPKATDIYLVKEIPKWGSHSELSAQIQ